MKSIKLIVAPVLLAVLAMGCSSTNITKLTTALAKDPATVSVRITTIYGTVTVFRTGCTNNVTVGPDGTMSIGKQ